MKQPRESEWETISGKKQERGFRAGLALLDTL